MQRTCIIQILATTSTGTFLQSTISKVGTYRIFLCWCRWNWWLPWSIWYWRSAGLVTVWSGNLFTLFSSSTLHWLTLQLHWRIPLRISLRGQCTCRCCRTTLWLRSCASLQSLLPLRATQRRCCHYKFTTITTLVFPTKIAIKYLGVLLTKSSSY